ncbi:Mu transposase domain-containing protein [Nonomuraea diastatica]|uniref:Mu transposase domain-containing protein n=1 Tax=Nonomuraea diastatica TaxID=1848329 RepID=UPI003CCC6E3F
MTNGGSRRVPTRSEHYATEQWLLTPLPTKPFETGRWFTPRVDRFAQVTVRMNKYSVPARYVGRQVRVLLHASRAGGLRRPNRRCSA